MLDTSAVVRPEDVTVGSCSSATCWKDVAQPFYVRNSR